MHYIRLLLLYGFLIAPFTLSNPASQDLLIGVQILEPISLEIESHLSFAAITSSDQASIVTLNTDGSLTSSLAGQLVSGMPALGQMRARGTPNTSYSVLHPPSAYLLHNDGHILALESVLIAGGTIRNFDSQGIDELTIGASLAVAPNQPPGFYSGSVRFTLTYN